MNSKIGVCLMVLLAGVILSTWIQHPTSLDVDLASQTELDEFSGSLNDILGKISERYQVFFAYETKLLANRRADIRFAPTECVERIINLLLTPTNLQYEIIDLRYIVIFPAEKRKNKCS